MQKDKCLTCDMPGMATLTRPHVDESEVPGTMVCGLNHDVSCRTCEFADCLSIHVTWVPGTILHPERHSCLPACLWEVELPLWEELASWDCLLLCMLCFACSEQRRMGTAWRSRSTLASPGARLQAKLSRWVTCHCRLGWSSICSWSPSRGRECQQQKNQILKQRRFSENLRPFRGSCTQVGRCDVFPGKIQSCICALCWLCVSVSFHCLFGICSSAGRSQGRCWWHRGGWVWWWGGGEPSEGLWIPRECLVQWSIPTTLHRLLQNVDAVCQSCHQSWVCQFCHLPGSFLWAVVRACSGLFGMRLGGVFACHGQKAALSVKSLMSSEDNCIAASPGGSSGCFGTANFPVLLSTRSWPLLLLHGQILEASAA